MKMTINKIAALAGVSRGAIDKVLHDRPGVRPEVRRRVLEVIQETGYTPLHLPKPPAAPHRKAAAVILPRQTNPFFAAMKRGMDHTCENMREAGLVLEYYFCDDTDINGMLAILDYLENRPIDAYLLRGVRSERLRRRVDALSERGIPIIFIDSDIPGAKRLCLIGEDCYRGGRIAASLLAKSIGFSGEVAMIGGSAEISAHRLRIQGFEDVMRERWPEIAITERLVTLDQSVIAYERTRALLDKRPGLRGIFSFDSCAGEIGQAIIDRHCKARVKMVCYNTTKDVAALIQKGIVQFSIGLAPFRQGQLVAETAGAYLLHGKKPHSAFLQTPIEIKLDENLEIEESSEMV